MSADGTNTEQPLAGQRVWLARPVRQAVQWARGLEAAGARVSVQPLIRIEPAADAVAARRGLAAAERADVVLATSPNAVAGAWRLRPDFAPRGQLLAVGDATAAVLQQAAGRAVAVPAAHDTSEGLLDMPVLTSVAGLSVALLSGRGGREKLRQTLAARGASVYKVSLYRREPEAIAAPRLAALINDNDAAVVTSGGALQHLCKLLQACDHERLQPGLGRLQLVVPSPRVVKLLPEDLFRRPARATARMTVDAVISALASGNMAAGNHHLTGNPSTHDR